LHFPWLFLGHDVTIFQSGSFFLAHTHKPLFSGANAKQPCYQRIVPWSGLVFSAGWDFWDLRVFLSRTEFLHGTGRIKSWWQKRF